MLRRLYAYLCPCMRLGAPCVQPAAEVGLAQRPAQAGDDETGGPARPVARPRDASVDGADLTVPPRSILRQGALLPASVLPGTIAPPRCRVLVRRPKLTQVSAGRPWRIALSLRVDNLGEDALPAGWTLSLRVGHAIGIDHQWGWQSHLGADFLWQGQPGPPGQPLLARSGVLVGGILRLQAKAASIGNVRVNGQACAVALWNHTCRERRRWQAAA